MIKISQKEQKIISLILKKGSIKSSGVHAEMVKKGDEISLVTVKRTLSKMVEKGLLILIGSGRATNYKISIIGRIFAMIDAKKYCSIEPDTRYGMNKYNFDLFAFFPSDIFTREELEILNSATLEYKRRTVNLPAAIEKKELERLIIEFSWKSSKIEGNTYTLLDTERLILKNQKASGHDKKEAQMILNHKDAFNFVRKNAAEFKTLTRKNLEEIHTILVKDMNVDLGLRKKPVGVIGSTYRPLDNIHQIAEAIEALGAAVSRMSTPYAKTLVALIGISYIQPFEDGNKRTARLMANAVLLAYGYAPLSYRSINEDDYREAMFVFYELNSIMPIKKIFINQYNFAAHNYAVK